MDSDKQDLAHEEEAMRERKSMNIHFILVHTFSVLAEVVISSPAVNCCSGRLISIPSDSCSSSSSPLFKPTKRICHHL